MRRFPFPAHLHPSISINSATTWRRRTAKLPGSVEVQDIIDAHIMPSRVRMTSSESGIRLRSALSWFQRHLTGHDAQSAPGGTVLSTHRCD
jgi:hypothetical protein